MAGSELYFPIFPFPKNTFRMSMIFNLLQVTPAELEAFKEDSAKLEDRIYAEGGDDENFTDIDKAWDGIIFLLTGKNFMQSDGPVMKAFFSDQLVDEAQDLGYGPAHYVTPQQVEEINVLFQATKEENLRVAFDPQKMMEAEVYPHIWDKDEELFDYILEYFDVLKERYAQAAAAGDAMITFMN